MFRSDLQMLPFTFPNVTNITVVFKQQVQLQRKLPLQNIQR